MSERAKLDISATSVLKIIAILAGVYLLYAIRDVLLLLFVAGILVAAFGPVIKKWSKKIGKPLAVTILVFLIIAVIAGFVSLIVPPFVNQTSQLIANIPDIISRSSFITSHLPELEKSLSSLTQNIGSITGGFISITTSVVGGIATFLTLLILTIYFLIDEQIFSRYAASVIPEDKKNDINGLIGKISTKIGEWLRGQLLLCLVIGITVYIGLSIIGVKYALALGVISGVLEVLPIVGPVFSAALAALISLAISPITALIVIVYYVLVQQFENNFLVPKIMSKAIGLPPAIIIIAILIGGKLLGVIGALLAVPISGIVYVIFQEWETVKKIATKE